MHFLENLPKPLREEVWRIVNDDVLDLWEKCSLLKDQIGDPDIFMKTIEFLKQNKKLSVDSFLGLVGERKRTVMRMIMKKGVDIPLLDRLIATESDEAKTAYEKWKKGLNSNSAVPKAAKSSSLGSSSIGTVSTSSSSAQFSESASSLSESVSQLNLEGNTVEDDDWEEVKDTAPEIDAAFFEQFPDILNILILGETGVGKSTFINGLVNYLKYGSIDEALENQVEILIKTYFTHTDVDYNAMKVECDPTIAVECGENENTMAGQSSTQSPKSYLFSWGPKGSQKAIRIIDTPGVGDVRGLDQEKENFSKILNFIADFSEIHAICILLKPNEAKLTLTFRYCINELLTHLHVSASKNILFCFTNARQSLYRPGDTRPTLAAHLEVLKEKRDIDIPLDENTMFCFDNESFRFLCALREGAHFEQAEIDSFNGSWEYSVKETFRLFKRISELPVHNVNDTLSINNIRSVILALARPLAEIARNQMMNVKLIEEKLKEVEDCILKGKDLEGRLYVDQLKIYAKEIPYPMTVCTATGCVDYQRISDNPSAAMETIYKTECHDHCYLKGVQTSICPNPAIQECEVFLDPDHCYTCNCPWTVHMHIRYKLEKVMEKTVDPTIQESIKNRDDQIHTARLFIAQEKKRKEELQEEADKISQSCVEFAAFLRKNSILPYNDVYKEYVEHLIKEEREKVSFGGADGLLQQLENYKDEYEQQVKLLESHGGVESSGEKTMRQIYNMVDDLKRMRNCGEVLAEIEKLELLSVREQQITAVTPVDLNTGWLGMTVRGETQTRRTRKRGGKRRKY